MLHSESSLCTQPKGTPCKKQQEHTNKRRIHCEFTLPPNVIVKRLPRAWNSSAQHRLIVRILGLALRPFMDRFQPILSFDAAPLHLTTEVSEEIRAAGLWFLLIPARLTWLLQPCDTHLFSRYKGYIKSRFQEQVMKRVKPARSD